MIVNQWVPAAHKGDAIGDSARRVRGLLRNMGHQSDLFALTIDEDLQDDVRPFADPAAGRGDLTIFHYALPSPMTEAFARLSHGRVLQYHNVTPAHFFAPYHAGVFRLAQLGRAELGTLAGRTDVALGDSEYNRAELETLGFTNTGVFPIAIDVERITKAPRRPALEKVLTDGPLNFLFVGRIVPNKKIEDHIKLAEVYKRYVDVNYRFIFVGKTDGMPRYYNMVRALIAEYQMPADRFWFTGPVPDEDLAAYYRTASVTSRSRSMKASVCRCSRRWPPTCPCWPMPQRRSPIRSAALACSSIRRISRWLPNFSASSHTTRRCARASSPASASGCKTSATAGSARS